jgi:hypothetical protein
MVEARTKGKQVVALYRACILGRSGWPWPVGATGALSRHGDTIARGHQRASLSGKVGAG